MMSHVGECLAIAWSPVPGCDVVSDGYNCHKLNGSSETANKGPISQQDSDHSVRSLGPGEKVSKKV